MEQLLDKLNQMEETKDEFNWDNWSLEERKKLLDIYSIISKKENQIFALIYNYHGCDSWEDIFRDYDPMYLKDKAIGVEIAIKELIEIQETGEGT